MGEKLFGVKKIWKKRVVRQELGGTLYVMSYIEYRVGNWHGYCIGTVFYLQGVLIKNI